MFVADLLDWLTQRASAERDVGNVGHALLMDRSPDLAQLVATWRNVPPSVLPSPETRLPDGLPEAARLRWLWSMLDPDPIPNWIRLSGLPDAPHVHRLCWVAIDNRMVLPDGSVSTWADQFIARTVTQALGGGRVRGGR